VKIEELQQDLQAVMMSLDIWTKNLCEELDMEVPETLINIPKRRP
jgi:hypothetical protein